MYALFLIMMMNWRHKKNSFPSPYFFLVNLKYETCRTTLRFSIKKTPQKTGINNSFLIVMAKTAMIPPSAKLPVSPINTLQDMSCTIKNPIQAPTNELIKITSSEELGIYRIFK